MPEVTHNETKHRYEIRLDDELAGFVDYRLRPGVIAFTHAEIDPQHGGQGLGSALVKGALDDADARGLAVMPFCPFVETYIQRHPDYARLVPQEHRAQFGL